MCSSSTGSCLAPTWLEREKVLVFPVGHTYARGLTKTLVADFTPEFSATVALKGVSRVKTKKHGLREGNRSDDHLSRWANEGAVPKAGADPRFDYIAQVLAAQRWLPVAAQCPVGCADLRLATKIDLVVQDVLGHIRILEIKCGFDDYFDVQNQGPMKHPFQHVPASFRNKAFLQLMVTEYLFHHTRHSWSSHEYRGAYLLHVFARDDDAGTLGHTLEPLPEWCRNAETLTLCLAVMKDSKAQTTHTRKRVMTNGCRRARSRYARQAPPTTPTTPTTFKRHKGPASSTVKDN